MTKTVKPYIKFTLILIFLMCLGSSIVVAQRGFDYNSREDANKKLYEQYRDELFDNETYEKFLKEQENALYDSLDVEKKILLSPEELKKLGIADEVIEEIIKLQLQQDSIGSIKDKYDKIKKQELGIKDSVSLEDVEELIERQKQMIVRKALSLPKVEMYGHGFFRKNLLKLFDEEVKMRVPENYTLSVGDEVSIVIWGDDNYNRSFVIDEEGAISPRRVDRIPLRGLTFTEAKSLLKKKFSTAFDLRKSNFKVSLNYTRVVSVNLVGELFNPGTYTFPALNSVYNALVSIEGPNNMGSVRNIFVKRNGETIKTFDLYKYLTDPDSKQDFFLEENDYVVVPSLKNLVAVAGEVKRPFTYEMIDGENLLDLLNYAGGLKPLAHTKAIAIKRVDNSEEVLLTVNYEELKNGNTQFEVEDGDSVFVYKLPEILRNYVQVEGAVKIPGRYQLRKGERIADTFLINMFLQKV